MSLAPYIDEVAEPFGFALGECEMDPSTTQLRRCNAELRIRLPASAMRKPATYLDPGIGFAMMGLDTNFRGGFPEETNDWSLFAGLLYRTNYQTLLFAQPKGWPLRIMSWNVRRSSLSALAGEFDVVGNAAVGKYLVGPPGRENDVIAIQEGWDLTMMSEVNFDPVNDMDPIPQCTGNHPMTLCYLFEASELPPGNQ